MRSLKGTLRTSCCKNASSSPPFLKISKNQGFLRFSTQKFTPKNVINAKFWKIACNDALNDEWCKKSLKIGASKHCSTHSDLYFQSWLIKNMCAWLSVFIKSFFSYSKTKKVKQIKKISSKFNPSTAVSWFEGIIRKKEENYV